MFDKFPISARAAAIDIARAKQWYADKLGATPASEDPGGLWYRFGDDTWLYLYPTANAGTAKNTIAGWRVKDLPGVMVALRARGVVFEDYDLPMMKTVNGMVDFGVARAAWFKDSEGNVLELSEVL